MLALDYFGRQSLANIDGKSNESATKTLTAVFSMGTDSDTSFPPFYFGSPSSCPAFTITGTGMGWVARLGKKGQEKGQKK